MRWWGWWRPPCVLRTVIVNLANDRETAIRGVLWQSRGTWLVLRNPQAIQPGRPPAAIDGEVVIERQNVTFMQVEP